MKMKTLSVQQPWAWAIFHGKDIENRDWYTPIRGDILIHASKKIDVEAFYWIETNFGLIIPDDLPTGGIVGKVNLFEVVTKSNSPWFFGKYGFLLKDQKELPFMPCLGKLRFFETEYIYPSGERIEDDK